MTPAEVKTMITSTGVSCAYYQFPDGTDQICPFICYFFDTADDFYADGINYVRKERLYIELYTDTKDFALESTVEGVLTSYELAFSKESTFLDSEHMHETIYTTEIFLEV